MKIKAKQNDEGTLPASPVRDVMDIKSLASYLSMGKSKIYALIRQKKIPASRIGRQYRFSRNVIDQWLNEKLITQRQEESQIPLFNGKTEPSGN